MNETTSDAANILAPLWKRKWLILAVAILAAAGTYLYYKNEPPVYTASTALYLGSGSEQQGTLGSAQSKVSLSGRALTDQVGLINSPVIGEAVHKQLRAEGDIAAARGKAKATASATSDFINIATEARTPRAAATLANDYAQAYIKRHQADYVRAVETAINNTREQLRRLEITQPTAGKGKGSKPSGAATSAQTIQAATLNSKLNQLESELSITGVQQVSTAKAAPLPISPQPKTNAVFGFVLGLALASVAAFVLSQFDRRLRSLSDIETVFRTQILAALPSVKSPIVRPDGQRTPAKPLLEPLRRLHATLQLGDVLGHDGEHGPRSVLFLSADAGDGRSSLIANLACIQRDAGERVAVIDADFRRPVQARLLDVAGERGLTDVLAGTLTYGEAMQSVEPRPPAGSIDGDGAAAGMPTLVESREAGALSVLVSGGVTANPPALLGATGMSDLLRSVREEYDHVLIDVPSPLEVSDAMPLLPLVDGIVIVARIGHTRDTSAQRLVQLLGRVSSAPVLGAVANCVRRSDIERYGFAWASGEQRPRRKLVRR